MEWTLSRSVSALAVLCCCCWALAAAAPYQELPPRIGHVPVYIREGETPLAEIHPQLAEAFHEDAPSRQEITHEAMRDEVAMDQDQKREAVEAEPEEPEEAKVEKVEKEEEKEATAMTKAEESAKPESDIASFDVVKSEEQKTEEETVEGEKEEEEEKKESPAGEGN